MKSKTAKGTVSEAYMVMAIVEYLKKDNYEVFVEVPSMGQSVDIVAKKGKYLSFIEAKIVSWKRGLQQCDPHQIVADYVYIAIATKKISNALYSEAKNLGYGIIHYDIQTDSVDSILKPKLNKSIWIPQRKYLTSKIIELRQIGKDEHTTLDDFRHVC
jgi:hypothetical protein